VTLDPPLIEPVCQAGMIAAVPTGKRSNGRLLFSNPADTRRVRMTVRLSMDDGKTWPAARVIHDGPAAYSSLAVLGDRSIGLLYERGEKSAYEMIAFARFGMDWVSSGSRVGRR
jgi:sialidase-1